MLATVRSFLTALAVILSLSACGGGSGNPPPVTPKQPVVDAPQDDVTLTQYATRVVGNPGERVDVTAFNIDCLRMADQHSFCASSTRMGDLGIVLPIGLVDPYLTFKGEPVPANHVREAQGLHLLRSYDWFVWEPGEARISAIVSPYATPGVSGGVELKATSAAIGRSVGVVNAKAEVKVIADPAYEPIVITSTQNYVNQEGFGELTVITLRCGDQVKNGCFVDWVQIVNDSSMHPVIGNPIIQGMSWLYETVEWMFDPSTGQHHMTTQVQGVWIAPGATGTVTTRGGQIFGRARVMVAGTWSGGKYIYPKLPQDCQAAIVSPETNCKG
jgi:hypothetical protein